MNETKRNWLIAVGFMTVLLLLQIVYVPSGKVEGEEVKVETTIVNFGEVKTYKKSLEFKLIQAKIEANVDYIGRLNHEKDSLMLQKIEMVLIPIHERTDSIYKKLQDKTIEIVNKKAVIKMYEKFVEVGEAKLLLVMEKEIKL